MFLKEDVDDMSDKTSLGFQFVNKVIQKFKEKKLKRTSMKNKFLLNETKSIFLMNYIYNWLKIIIFC